MSTERLPLKPKGDGWIQTKKMGKQPTQRPLVGPNAKVHKGIFTPPASTSRKRGAPASNLSSSQRKKPRSSQPLATPTAAPPIRTLDNFFTPPATTQRASRTKERQPKPVSTSQTAKPLSDEAISDFLSNPPSRDSPVGAARLDSSQSRPASRARSTSKAPVRLEPLTPHQPASSQLQLTQCPASVLARHQRLCGQDEARRRATRSPWREITEDDEAAELEGRKADRQARAEKLVEEKERKRLRLDVRDSVERQARERVEGARERRALGKFKSLVYLSSESSSSPLASSSPTRTGEEKQRALRPYSSAVEEPVCERETQWPRPPALQSSRLAAMPLKRRTSPFKPYFDRPRETTPSPTKGKSPTRLKPAHLLASPSPQRSPTSVTPRKKHRHHHVTPPKSRTPQGNQPETLFVYPLPKPPAQPVFIPGPRPISDWRPVEMEAETLMTWSLGGGDQSAPRVDLPPSDPPVFDLPTAGPSSDELPPSEPPQPADFRDPDADETQSIAPSVPSQTFPDLISSSPAKPSPQPARRHAGFPLFPSPRRSVSPSKKLVRRAGSPKRVVNDSALFSSLGNLPAAPKPGPLPPPTQKRAKRPSQKKDTQQAKLDVFGYFPTKTRKVENFETSFSDEEDLDFGDELEGWTPRAAGGRGSVPEPPAHPSLREAGRRELARRDAEAMERHWGQQRGSDGVERGRSQQTGTDSSSLTPDDGPQTSESTRRWFAELGASSDESL